MQYCENLYWGNYPDWRLPNKNELASLLDKQVFSGILWSSTTDTDDTNSAWTMDSDHSNVASDIKTNLHNVKCMRSDNYLGYCGDGILQSGFEICEPIESPAGICSRVGGSSPHYGYNNSWKHISVNGREAYCSRTQGKHGSTATMIVTLPSPTTFYVYGTSQNSGDYLTISQNGSQFFSSQGRDYESWNEMSPMRGILYFSYRKDGNGNSGTDSYCISFSSAPSSIYYSDNSNVNTNPSTTKCGNNCRLGSGECYIGWCGDGIVQSPYEFCDSGSSQNNDNWSQSRHCNSTCTGWAPYCGDGFINGGETCEPSSFTPSQCYGDIHREKCDTCGSEYLYEFSIYETTCSSDCRIIAGTLLGNDSTGCGSSGIPSPQCNY